MLINVSEGEECRIAILEDGRLKELYMERTSSTSHVGNIYKGRVTNVEPSIQAAFVDFGLGRNGFLHISDLMPTYFGRKGEDYQETVGRKMARRDRPPIQRCLRRGDEIIVQIIKEGIGTKGPTLTTYLSVPGKILVMMPGMGNSGVSRKIEDEDERRRLRQILDALEPPEDAGFIIRTAGIGATKAEIQRDLTYLARLWMTFKKKRDSGPGPLELYTEGDLVTRTVRDVFTTDVDKLIIDNKDVAKRVKDVIKLSSPRTKNKVELYEEPIPLFSKFGVEREIELMYSRHVPLPSGGSLVIDSTEAIVAIDVNSGKNRANADAETTAFKVDMEAADEICRQLKLRDLGGVIICDFIDLRYERHRRDLEKRLDDNLKDDRAKTKVLRMSQFGIIEMTRQRMRPSLKRSVYFDCPHCKGAGLVKTPESMSLDVMRRLRIAINDLKVQRLELTACPDVVFYLQNKKRQQLGELERIYDKRIVIRADAQLGLDEMKIDLYDGRDGLVFLEQLGMVPQPPHTTQLGTKPQPFPQRGRGGRDERSRGGRQAEPQRQAPTSRNQDEDAPDDRFERVEQQYDEQEREDDDAQSPQEQPPRQDDRPAPRDDSHGRREEPRGGRNDSRGGRNDSRGGRGPHRDRPQPQVHRQPPRPIDSDEVESPALETEAGSEAADPTETMAGQGQGGTGEEGGGPRRRRRRRGRRGRGRNRQGEGQPQAAVNGHPSDSSDNGDFNRAESGIREEADEDHNVREDSSDSVDEGNYAPNRRDDRDETFVEEVAEKQAKAQPVEEPAKAEEEAAEPAEAKPRRRRRGGRGRTKKPAAAKAEASDDEDSPKKASTPAASRAEPEPEPVVVRTGSTDRHLIEDEPAFPQPVRRPRSVRDLDSIPDDFD